MKERRKLIIIVIAAVLVLAVAATLCLTGEKAQLLRILRSVKPQDAEAGFWQMQETGGRELTDEETEEFCRLLKKVGWFEVTKKDSLNGIASGYGVTFDAHGTQYNVSEEGYAQGLIIWGLKITVDDTIWLISDDGLKEFITSLAE